MKSNYTPKKAAFIGLLIVLLFFLLCFAGCKNKQHSNPYTIRINANTDTGYNALDSTYSLMDNDRVVSTFTDSKLDSIILNDNQ